MQIVISNLKVGKSKTQITVSDQGFAFRVRLLWSYCLPGNDIITRWNTKKKQFQIEIEP